MEAKPGDMQLIGVWESISDYLVKARPDTKTKQVFLKLPGIAARRTYYIFVAWCHGF